MRHNAVSFYTVSFVSFCNLGPDPFPSFISIKIVQKSPWGLEPFGSGPAWGAVNSCESDPYASLKQAKKYLVYKLGIF